MSQLSSLIGSLKSECGNVIERVEAEGDFSEIWAKDAEAKLAQFLDHEPSLAEYQEQIRLFHVNISAAKCVWVSRVYRHICCTIATATTLERITFVCEGASTDI